jgi:hypothetical protein
VALQLFDHSQSKNGFLAGVIENVDANQASQKLLAAQPCDGSQPHVHIIDFKYRKSIYKLAPTLDPVNDFGIAWI